MNINQIMKAVNTEKAMEGVQYGNGTFKDLFNDVMSGKIYPLVNNAGDIQGIGVETGKVGAEDSIEQMKFERAYCNKPVMCWAIKSFEIKCSGKQVNEVVENKYGVKVIYNDNTEEIISGNPDYVEPERRVPEPELPSEVTIPYADLEEEGVKDYLRNTYNHYLAGGTEPNIDWDNEEEVVRVTNIQWGRKR